MFRRLLLPALAALAILAILAPRASADTVEEETRRIGKQLQCPVCSGAPVSDSPSELAGQMRSVIRAKLEAGESEQQIVAYFVERYGDSVLIEPPRHGVGLAVWLAPIAALLVGGVVLWRLLSGWLRPRRAAALMASARVAGPVEGEPARNGTGHGAPASSASPIDRARAELDRYRRGA